MTRQTARAGLWLGGATVQIAVGSQPEVPGDHHQLVRLLELLIDRAVRAAHASTVTFAVEREGAGVRVRVIDDGKLVTRDEAAAMFDGRADVLITGVGGNHLFHNDGGGKFTDVTAAAGVGGTSDDWTTAASFIDYDNDGKLDLFVCSYVRWSRKIDFGVVRVDSEQCP